MSSQDATDARNLTFSQAQGYHALPQPLKLEELNDEARTKLWSLLYKQVKEVQAFLGADYFGHPWSEILLSIHEDVLHQPADEFDTSYFSFNRFYKRTLEGAPFNEVFDLLQAMMRHPHCPLEFTQSVSRTFRDYRLAYMVDIRPPPTIYPAATEEEGVAVLRATTELSNAGLAGAVSHLRQASACISQGDYSGAVRESIHSVESTARRIDPNAKTLEPALKSLEKEKALHPALKQAFSNLYGYTSDEQGIRHALIDNRQPNVGQDEAVFMLGACASFSSYLARKHQRQAS